MSAIRLSGPECGPTVGISAPNNLLNQLLQVAQLSPVFALTFIFK
jgi:hypothetical protein